MINKYTYFKLEQKVEVGNNGGKKGGKKLKRSSAHNFVLLKNVELKKGMN